MNFFRSFFFTVFFTVFLIFLDNILVDDFGRAMIFDFGEAFFFETAQFRPFKFPYFVAVTSLGGCATYLPPELRKGNLHIFFD